MTALHAFAEPQAFQKRAQIIKPDRRIGSPAQNSTARLLGAHSIIVAWPLLCVRSDCCKRVLRCGGNLIT